MLELKEVGFRWGNGSSRWIVKDIDVSFDKGAFWGLVGPNGSGKSTLLRLISGDLKPLCGSICLEGKQVHQMTPQALASRRSFLSQKSALRFPFTAEEVVEMGRYHRSLKPVSNGGEVQGWTTQKAMQAAQVEALAARMYPTLSGGEACRVDIARVLAQDTPMLLLDEPTNHLDPRYQLTVLSLCRQLAREGALVIAALHDLNLAAQYCDQMLMLKEGLIAAKGTPDEVLQPEQLQEVYEIPFDVHTSSERPFVIPTYPA